MASTFLTRLKVGPKLVDAKGVNRLYRQGVRRSDLLILVAAAAAVDGNPGTRWSSAFSDPQWLQVDLGATAAIGRVTLNWEAAYGRAFQIQTSANGSSWTTIYSTTTGSGGVQNLTVSGSGRYVRMYGTGRGTPYGYSLWEFQVFGTGGTPPTNPTTPPPTTRIVRIVSLFPRSLSPTRTGQPPDL